MVKESNHRMCCIKAVISPRMIDYMYIFLVVFYHIVLQLNKGMVQIRVSEEGSLMLKLFQLSMQSMTYDMIR